MIFLKKKKPINNVTGNYESSYDAEKMKEIATVKKWYGELFALMKEAAKAEFLMNAAKCEVPYVYAREMATGEKEEHPTKIYQMKKDAGAAGEGSVRIIRKDEQGVEWIDVQDIIRKGRAGVFLPVGTEINFELKNRDQATAVIVAQNHYEQGDVVFWLRKIVGCGSMNDDNTNEGGFAASKMRGYLENEIFNLLPDALQDAIAVHTVTQKIDGDCHLFLPSEFELQGRTLWSKYNRQNKQFEFTKERRNRVAYDDDGVPCWYWTADPSVADPGFLLFLQQRHQQQHQSEQRRRDRPAIRNQKMIRRSNG